MVVSWWEDGKRLLHKLETENVVLKEILTKALSVIEDLILPYGAGSDAKAEPCPYCQEWEHTEKCAIRRARALLWLPPTAEELAAAEPEDGVFAVKKDVE